MIKENDDAVRHLISDLYVHVFEAPPSHSLDAVDEVTDVWGAIDESRRLAAIHALRSEEPSEDVIVSTLRSVDRLNAETYQLLANVLMPAEAYSLWTGPALSWCFARLQSD